MNRHVLFFAFTGLAVVLAGCGGSQGGGAMPPASASPLPSSAPTPAPTSAPSGETLAVAGYSAGELAFYPVGAPQASVTYPPALPAGQPPTQFKPFALAADGYNNVFAIDQYGDDALGFPPPYTGSPVTFAGSGGIQPFGIAVTQQGTVFIALTNIFGFAGQAVLMYGAPYNSSTALPVPSGIHFAASCLTVDGQGDLFATNSDQYNGDPGTLEYVPPYTAMPVSYPFGGSASAGFSTGATCAADTANGELFIGYAAKIDAYAPPYTGTPTTIAETTSSNESFAVLSTNHDLFVANGTSVDVYSPPYTSITATITSGVNQPNLVAVDAGGNVFVGSTYNATVNEYAPPYTGAPVWTLSGAFTNAGSTSYLLVVP